MYIELTLQNKLSPYVWNTFEPAFQSIHKR